MRFNKTLVVGAALVLATACGGVDDQEAVDSLPDLAGTVLELNTDAPAQDGASVVAQDLAQVESALDGQGAAMLEGARLPVKAINDALRQALAPIKELVTKSPSQSGKVLVYGPRDRVMATYRLLVREGVNGRYQWKLQARPLGSTNDSDYTLIAAGSLKRDGDAHRGRGTLAINLSNLKDMAPSFTGQGKLMMSFVHFEQGTKSLAYRLVDFTPDTRAHEPVTGISVGHKLQGTGVTRLRVLGAYSLPGTATTAKEKVLTSLRHIPGTGGRADLRAWGGDIPAGTFYTGSACWDAQEKELFRVLFQCTEGAGTCQEVPNSRVGSQVDCRGPELRGEVSPPDGRGEVATPEPGNPGAPDDLPADVTAEF